MLSEDEKQQNSRIYACKYNYILTSNDESIAVISLYPTIIQTFNVAMESNTMTGTKYAAIVSANFWIGACAEKQQFC